MSEFFTSQTGTDRETILKICDLAKRGSRLRFLEVGVFYGSTANGILDWCQQNSIILDYFGCDDFSHPNFAGAKVNVVPGGRVWDGASWDVFHQMPDDMDVVFIDGNHSGNAVILDTALYAPKVRRGGYLMFHDTAPQVQQTMPEQNAPNHPWWSNSVNAAHELIGWPWPGWVLVLDEFDPSAATGGIRVYQKA